MVYSMNDLYPFSSNTLATTKQTIAEADEQNKYTDNVVSNEKGQIEVVKKGSIWFGLIALVLILFLFGFLKG
jgi:hypothetical protein